ncbi:MAG: argininosuccinate lyase [Candidatus Omnitrophica bacterium]|nr:argininosuccinate lyase [Candidatus Omnitrophota bacterium]
MAKKLWGGRFSKKTDPMVEEFTKSIDHDYKLAEYDVMGSKIHVRVLRKSGLLTSQEETKLMVALNKISGQIENGKFNPDKKCEDIHTNIQNLLEKNKIIGDLVLKLHAARSRNDQVLFSLKLFCKTELLELNILCVELQKSLLGVVRKNIGLIIPGYTHLQHAQLVLLSDYLQSYVEMLERDDFRLSSIRNNIKLSLGAGALAGTPIEPKKYKDAIKEFLLEEKELAKVLNIEESLTTPKSIETVSDRDFVIEILSALSILGMHLSRLAEDLIVWSTKEFGFVELDDAFATGSSLMPQKKNPDVLELIRGYTGTLYGNLVSVLTVMKGLPLTYNRDMQLDKPPLFSSFEIIEKELKVLPKLIETLKWNKANIKKVIDEDETLYATDLVYYLIGKNIPFKNAHDIIGKLVKFSLNTGRKIKDMKDQELKQFSNKLKHDEIYKLIDPEVSVLSRVSVNRTKIKEKEKA